MLYEIGRTLCIGVRGSNVVCRYGGEELIVILPESARSDTIARAEGLRTAIAELRVAYQSTTLAVTASLGVALYPEHGERSDHLLRAADRALYQAKADGRDRIAVANPKD